MWGSSPETFLSLEGGRESKVRPVEKNRNEEEREIGCE